MSAPGGVLLRLARSHWDVAALAALTVLVRLRGALAAGVIDADEAAALLGVRRMVVDGEIPLLYPGQAYLGGFDLILAGLIELLTGSAPVLAGRIVSVGLSAASVVLVFLLAAEVAGRRAARASGLFVAVGPTMLVTMGSRFYPGYLDMIWLGSLLLLLTVRVLGGFRNRGRVQPVGAAAIGLAAGLGLWIHPLFLSTVAAAALTTVVVLFRTRRFLEPSRLAAGVGAAAIGLALGLTPYALANVWGPGLPGGGSETDLAMTLAVGVVNLVSAVVPVFLGVSTPWAPFRAEFGVELAPALLLPILAVVIAALVAAAIVAHRTRRWGLAGAAAAAVTWIGLLVAAAVVPRSPAFAGSPVIGSEWLRFELLSPPVSFLFLCLLPVLVRPIPPREEDHGASPASWIGRTAIALQVLLALALYLLSPYAVMRSPRFLQPAYPAVAVLIGLGYVRLQTARRGAGTAWLGVLLLLVGLPHLAAPAENLLLPTHYVGRVELPSSYRPLAACLEALEVDAVYAPYWTGIPLALETGEQVAVSTGRPGRFPELHRKVIESHRPAVVLLGSGLHRPLFERLLANRRVPAAYLDCGEFRVYLVEAAELRAQPTWTEVQSVLDLP